MISDWFNFNNVSHNIKKTCFVVFGIQPQNDGQSLKIENNNPIIDKVQSTGFLGVQLDESLSSL